MTGLELKPRGYLVYEDDRWLVVALAVNASGYSLGRLVIPKAAIMYRSDGPAQPFCCMPRAAGTSTQP